MIDIEYINIVNAAFGLCPVHSEADIEAQWPTLTADLRITIGRIEDRIEERFKWYETNVKPPLLPNEKRAIALAIAEAMSAVRRERSKR